MKRTLLLLLFAAGVSLTQSCNSTKVFAGKTKVFLEKHNAQETHVFNPATGESKFKASIQSLYDSTSTSKLCQKFDVLLHFTTGGVEVDADCAGAGQTITEAFKNLLGSIRFNK